MCREHQLRAGSHCCAGRYIVAIGRCCQRAILVQRVEFHNVRSRVAFEINAYIHHIVCITCICVLAILSFNQNKRRRIVWCCHLTIPLGNVKTILCCCRESQHRANRHHSGTLHIFSILCLTGHCSVVRLHALEEHHISLRKFSECHSNINIALQCIDCVYLSGCSF